MLEHILIQIAVWGGGTFLVCLAGYWCFKWFQNPFDELDEEEIKEFDELGKTLTDLTGNINKILP